MTSPDRPCTCGVARLGDRVGELEVHLYPGRPLTGSFQLRDRSGVPLSWPADMAARLWFSWGTGAALIIPGTVGDSWLRFQMTPAETEQVPRGATVRVELNYTGGPDDWMPWRQGRVGAC